MAPVSSAARAARHRSPHLPPCDRVVIRVEVSQGASWVAVETAGDAGSPVLLLMGMGARRAAWRLQVEGLSPTHRVAWFDNRGMGDSGPITDRLSTRTMAEDSVAVLDSLGWERAHVVGISMGGMVAQELALGWPGRVLSTTLIATHAGGGLGPTLPTPRGGFLWLQRTVAASVGAQSWKRRALTSLLHPPEYVRGQRAELEERIGEVFGSTPAEGATLRAQFKAVVGHDTRDRLAQLGRLPVLVVRPGRDVLVVPKHSDRMHAAIPGSELMELPEAGHGVLGQCSDALNPRLRAFLGAVDLAS